MTELIHQQWQQITGSSWLLGLSLVGFSIGLWVYRRSGSNAFLHPLLIGTPIIASLLYLWNIDFEHYYQALSLIHISEPTRPY